METKKLSLISLARELQVPIFKNWMNVYMKSPSIEENKKHIVKKKWKTLWG